MSELTTADTTALRRWLIEHLAQLLGATVEEIDSLGDEGKPLGLPGWIPSADVTCRSACAARVAIDFANSAPNPASRPGLACCMARRCDVWRWLMSPR